MQSENYLIYLNNTLKQRQKNNLYMNFGMLYSATVNQYYKT